MTSITFPAARGFTSMGAARELDVSVATILALLRSGRLRTVAQSSDPPIDPIAVYDCVIEACLWANTRAHDGKRRIA